jgi:hypothetical protein
MMDVTEAGVASVEEITRVRACKPHFRSTDCFLAVSSHTGGSIGRHDMLLGYEFH